MAYIIELLTMYGYIIRRAFKGKLRKESLMKLYTVMAISVLLSGSKVGVLTGEDESWIQLAEMQFLRVTKRCTREDRLCNNDVSKAINVLVIHGKIEDNKTNGNQYL